MNRDPKQSFIFRATVFEIGFFGAVALILLRLFIISVSQHGYYQALAENQHNFFQDLLPARGEIYIQDKYGGNPFLVATNTKKDMVYAVPREVKDPELTATTLAAILAIDKTELLAKITDQQKKNYVPLMRQLSEEQSKKINEAKLSGIRLEQENLRYYPEGAFLSQVLGFVGFRDNAEQRTGLYGIEKYFEKELSGIQGLLATQTDFRGNWITGSKRDFTPAKDGESIVLTIDRSIQFKAESVLKDSVIKHGAESGSVIVADPKTGAILAMANYPSFDPNQYGKAESPSVYQNLATTQVFEPGSTIKAITMAAGIDSGVVSPSTTYEDKGYIDVDGYRIKNSEPKPNGIQNMVDVLDKSLNTGAIFVEQQLGNERFLSYLKKFGFGEVTNIELLEGKGSLANLNQKTQVNFFTAAFGQGITSTPIQMLQAFDVFANKGIMMQPYIIDSITDNGKQILKTEPKEVRKVISEKTASLLSAMLVDVVENGHGKRAGVRGYYIGGKTGTAQVAKGGSYDKSETIGSFIGFGPVENPRFLMLVTVNKPQGVRFAESTAAPAFGEIAEFILNYYKIPPSRK